MSNEWPMPTLRIRLNPLALSKIKRLSDDNLVDIAELVADEAKDLAPVDTGALRDGIYADADAEGAFVATDTGGSSDAPDGYGGYVELGTTHMAAQPFMMPALGYVQDQIGTAWTGDFDIGWDL